MSTATATAQPTKFTTGVVRLSYVKLVKPGEGQSKGKTVEKWSTTLLIPKADKDTLAKIKKAHDAAFVNKFGTTRQPPAKPAVMHDGDGVRPSDGMPYGDECKGHYVMAVASMQKPGIVNLQLEEIIDPAEIYSGMYARVSLNAYYFEVDGKKGISFGLNNVQKVRDGEPLGGTRSRAEDDFGDGFAAPETAGADANDPFA